jgi:ElaB/YqjD/DUF883 family membrane-anchored ribosome-binding protein
MRDTLNHVKKNGIQFFGGARERCADIAENVQDAAYRSQKTLHRWSRKAGHALHEGSETLKDAAITANRQVRKNPWAYVSGALGAGLLVGFVAGKLSKREPWQR